MGSVHVNYSNNKMLMNKINKMFIKHTKLEQFAQEIPMNILKQVDYGCEKQIAIYKHHQWAQSM